MDQQFHSTVNFLRCVTNKFATDASEWILCLLSKHNATSVDCFTNALGLISSVQLFLNIRFEGTRILQTATFYVRPFTLLTIPLLKIGVSPEKTEKLTQAASDAEHRTCYKS